MRIDSSSLCFIYGESWNEEYNQFGLQEKVAKTLLGWETRWKRSRDFAKLGIDKIA
jgi:hypothetical protein